VSALTRRPASIVMMTIGVACVIAGGLVAAVTDPLSLAVGSWAAAYLVLVAGVAQVAYGALQQPLAPRPVSSGIIVAETVFWNAGNAAVLAGTAASLPFVVDAGGLLLVIALILFLLAVRGAAVAHRWWLWVYRALTAILLVSIPVGLTLAHLRA